MSSLPSSESWNSSSIGGSSFLESENSSKFSKSASFSNEATEFILSYIYKIGIREEWISEDEDDVVFLLNQEETGGEELLSHPRAVIVDSRIRKVIAEAKATCGIIASPSSIKLILESYGSISRLETGHFGQIPIFDEISDIQNLPLYTGCFIVRDGSYCITYSRTTDIISKTRQMDAALTDIAFTTLHSNQNLTTTNFKSEEQLIDPISDQQVSWLSTLESEKHTEDSGDDEKKEDESSESEDPMIEQDRKPVHIHAVLSGLGVAVNMVIMAIFARDIVMSTLYDQNFSRLLLLVAIIPRFFVSQFFCDHIILILAQLFFPISQMHLNSLYYSGKPSKPLPKGYTLPHFTVQMPCYKEGLQTVLAPSLKSVKAAVDAYRSIGGTVNVIISEDGLRSIAQEQAEQRIRFYNAMGCGWVARPTEGWNGYKRLGRFKKASNLNYTYTISLRLAEKIQSMRSEGIDETELYGKALAKVLEEDGNVWANGDIRIGDYILMIDSDTRVPENCLIQAAAEMERSPDVAALQHCSGITYVQHHYFERLLGYFVGVFTNFSISWVCANGAVAPIMGHNVFLRWKALQQVKKNTLESDQGEIQIFSSYHVSEDYELAMRLQMAGYCIRWATYSNQEFREGVSLNPYDEKTRWQKYAFGACELVFHPLKKWYKGPVDWFFLKYLWSGQVDLASKLASLSYLASYFALAISLPMIVFSTVLTGLFWPTIDSTFRPSFDSWVAVVIVFNLAGAVGLMTCRARSGNCSFWRALWDSFQHLPAIVIFFSGITYHVATSILAFFFSFNVSWNATSKDFQQTTLGDVLRRFWHCYLAMTILFAAGILSMSPLIPFEWRIESFIVLFPLFLSSSMHILFPILLDPGILHKFIPRYYTASKAEEGIRNSKQFFYEARKDDGRANLSNKDMKSTSSQSISHLTETASYRNLNHVHTLSYLQ